MGFIRHLNLIGKLLNHIYSINIFIIKMFIIQKIYFQNEYAKLNLNLKTKNII